MTNTTKLDGGPSYEEHPGSPNLRTCHECGSTFDISTPDQRRQVDAGHGCVGVIPFRGDTTPLSPVASLFKSTNELISYLDRAREIIRDAEYNMGGTVAVTHCGGYMDLLLDNMDVTGDQARNLLARLGKRMVPVTVTVELALDLDAWQSNYGLESDLEVPGDMRNLLREAVEEFVSRWIESTGNAGDANVRASN